MTTPELHAVLRIETGDGFHMKMNHPGYGELVLPIADPAAVMSQSTDSSAGPNESEAQAFQRDFQVLVDQRDLTGAYGHAQAFSQRFPLHAHAYTLQGACAESMGQLEKAAFHFRQSIAIRPAFTVLADLGRILGKQKRLEDSRIVLRFLFDSRDQASSPQQAIGFTQTLLVTLTQLQRGEEMVQVADAAITSYGPATVFHYQAILGLLISGRAGAGLKRLQAIEPQLNPADPMTSRLAQLRPILKAKAQATPSQAATPPATRFFIAGRRPVRIDDGPRGRQEVALDWQTGEFLRTDIYIQKIFRDHSPDIDEVDERTFHARVEAIRQKLREDEG